MTKLDTGTMLASILAIAADAVITIDDAQRIIQYNHGAEEIFGWSASEVIGRPLDILLPDRFREMHARHVNMFGHAPEAARRMGERREIFGLRKSGEEFPAEASIAKLDVDSQRVYSVVLRDVTERRQVEMALRRATQARDAILAIVAHDLRSPLSGVALCTRALLASPAPDDAARTEIVGAIDEAVGWMDRMIADLLDISQIEAGRLALEMAEIDIATTLDKTASHYHAAAADREITITSQHPGVFPRVLADPQRLQQVLSNLIGNALKFTPPGGEIRLSAYPEQEQVVVTVSDTGTGIPEDQLPYIFQPYWHRRRGTPRGTGLGLAIVKGIVQAHGGRVWAESAMNQGSTFSLSLPTLTKAE